MMVRNWRLIGGGAVVAALVAAVVFVFSHRQAAPSANDVTFLERGSMHYAGKPSFGIRTIAIRAFYFVPADATTMYPDWHAVADEALEQVKKFYEVQLQGAATVQYELYDKPVIGQFTRSQYDGGVEALPDGENQKALRSVHEELSFRSYTSGGDLYRKDAVTEAPETYHITIALYEGQGAAALPPSDDLLAAMRGKDRAPTDRSVPVLLARRYLTDSRYRDYGPTLLAYEIARALGLADTLARSKDNPNMLLMESDDLLGLGTFRPLRVAFLSRESLKLLGLE